MEFIHSYLLKFKYLILLIIAYSCIYILEARSLLSNNLNVLSYGAIGDGNVDDTNIHFYTFIVDI